MIASIRQKKGNRDREASADTNKTAAKNSIPVAKKHPETQSVSPPPSALRSGKVKK